VSELLLIM